MTANELNQLKSLLIKTFEHKTICTKLQHCDWSTRIIDCTTFLVEQSGSVIASIDGDSVTLYLAELARFGESAGDIVSILYSVVASHIRTTTI